MSTSPIAGLALGALIITLAGCEAAEESAQRLQENAEQAVQEVAREAVSDTVQAFNKQADEAQQAVGELLGRLKDHEAAAEPDRDKEAPAELPGDRVET